MDPRTTLVRCKKVTEPTSTGSNDSTVTITGAAAHNLVEEHFDDDQSSLDGGIHEASDSVQNQPLW